MNQTNLNIGFALLVLELALEWNSKAFDISNLGPNNKEFQWITEERHKIWNSHRVNMPNKQET